MYGVFWPKPLILLQQPGFEDRGAHQWRIHLRQFIVLMEF